MFKKLLNKHSTLTAIVLFIAVIVACFATSWLITCGFIKLITLCFGWTFSWSVATGIWLLMCLARTVFQHTVVKK